MSGQQQLGIDNTLPIDKVYQLEYFVMWCWRSADIIWSNFVKNERGVT
jgi:hypothetical protein